MGVMVRAILPDAGRPRRIGLHLMDRASPWLAGRRGISINRDWLTLSMNQTHGDGGICFGDSGGPHFLGSTIVALTITGDAICKANDKTYRLDTPSSLVFVGQYLSLP